MPILVKAFVGTGFCGAYTTFSTWSFETVRLVEEGEYLEAFANAIGSLLLGLLAAGGGMALGLLIDAGGSPCCTRRPRSSEVSSP